MVLGKLHAKPVARTSRNGNEFVTAALLMALADGATLYVSGCAFDGEARRALLALDKDDSVALWGRLQSAYFSRTIARCRAPSVSVTIHAVLSPYDVQRRRKATRAALHGGHHETNRGSRYRVLLAGCTTSTETYGPDGRPHIR